MDFKQPQNAMLNKIKYCFPEQVTTPPLGSVSTKHPLPIGSDHFIIHKAKVYSARIEN